MIFGELGVTPIESQIKSRVFIYWSKILNAKDDKIIKLLFDTALNLHNAGWVIFSWIEYIMLSVYPILNLW